MAEQKEMSMQKLIDWMPGYEWQTPEPTEDDYQGDEDDEKEDEEGIRAITLWQPWASLIVAGLKRYETRSWQTSYRGKLAIHAAKRPMDEKGFGVWKEVHRLKSKFAANPKLLPFGKIIAIADLTACLEMVTGLSGSPSEVCNIHLQTETEIFCGDWQVGRFAWKLENLKCLMPIPAKGKQQLWIPDSDSITQINTQLGK